MPGLIDAHVHLTFSALSQAQMMAPDMTAQMGEDAAAAVISQTSGHGDFRLPTEPSRRFTGKPSRAELLGATFIADGRDEVLTAVRENLRMGASQIKLMAGGGTSSAYDPIDVTQYTLDEMKAAVEAADDWNTYVTVHAYTPRAVRRAIEAGVKCIEHGQLLDEATLQLMADRGIWLSAQNLVEDSPNMDPLRREKRREVVAGNSRVWPIAKGWVSNSRGAQTSCSSRNSIPGRTPTSCASSHGSPRRKSSSLSPAITPSSWRFPVHAAPTRADSA